MAMSRDFVGHVTYMPANYTEGVYHGKTAGAPTFNWHAV